MLAPTMAVREKRGFISEFGFRDSDFEEGASSRWLPSGAVGLDLRRRAANSTMKATPISPKKP